MSHENFRPFHPLFPLKKPLLRVSREPQAFDCYSYMTRGTTLIFLDGIAVYLGCDEINDIL